MKALRDMTNEELQNEALRLTKIYNNSHDAWHR